MKPPPRPRRSFFATTATALALLSLTACFSGSTDQSTGTTIRTGDSTVNSSTTNIQVPPGSTIPQTFPTGPVDLPPGRKEPALPRDVPPPREPPPERPPAGSSPGQPGVLAVDPRFSSELPKAITQTVTLDLKLGAKPEVEIPVTVKLPSEEQRKISLSFVPDPAGPPTVPIKLQVTTEGQIALRCSCDCCQEKENNRNGTGGESKTNPPGKEDKSPARVSVRLLGWLILGAGVLGGFLRSLEKPKAPPAGYSDGSSFPPAPYPPGQLAAKLKQLMEKVVRSEWLRRIFVNVLWGILAAALVPACLVATGSSLLKDMKDNPAQIFALFGFCVIAATLGAEFIALAQSSLRRAMEKLDNPKPGQPPAGPVKSESGENTQSPTPTSDS